MIIKISENIKMKKEEQTGEVFNKKTGNIVELDDQAFNLIQEIRNHEILDTKDICKTYSQIQKSKIESVITELRKLGILIRMPNFVI